MRPIDRPTRQGILSDARKASRGGLVLILLIMVVCTVSLALLIGTLNTLIEFKRHIWNTYERAALLVIPQAKDLHKVPAKKINSSFFFQYIGSTEAPFFRFFTKSLPTSERIIPVTEFIEIYGPEKN